MKDLKEILMRCSLEWREDGLAKITEKKEDWISSFLPVVTGYGETLSDNQKLLDMDIYFPNDQEAIHKKGIPQQNLTKLDWSRDVDSSCMVAPYKGKVLLQMLYFQIMSMECVPVVNRIGWHLYKDKRFYCLGSEIIGDVSLNVSEKLRRTFSSEAKQRENKEIICGKILNMLYCCGQNGYSLFLTALYSVLRKVFEDAGIQKIYVLYIYGKSATYKTALAKYFSCWGSGWERENVFSLESTNNAREAELERFSDCICVLDDLAPMENRAASRQRNDQISSIIRSTANHADRKKTVGKTTKSITVDALLAVTAERLLDVESIMNRCWLLSTDKYPVSKKFLDFMRAYPDLIGMFLPFFIGWVIDNYDKVVQMIRSKWKYYHASDEELEKVNPRLYETYKVIWIAQDILKNYVEEVLPGGWIRELDKLLGDFLKRTYNDNITTIKETYAFGENQSLEKKVIYALCQIMDSGELKISKKYISHMLEDYEGRKYTYIRSLELLNLLNDKPGLEKLTTNRLSRILKNRHLIVSEDKDLQVKKKGKRYYKFDTAVLDNELEYARYKRF